MDSVSDTRVLGAVRVVDVATRRALDRQLRVAATDVRFRRNRQNLYVITTAPGLEHHTREHTLPPQTPPLDSVAIALTIADPAFQYLPRTATIRLPRDPHPDRGDLPGSLFQPVDVPVLPSASVRTEPNWSLVRGSVRSGPGHGDPIAGALLLVRRENGTVIGRGVSDERGEVLVVIPGIPIVRFSNDPLPPDSDSAQPSPVVETTTPALAELSRPAAARARTWPVDPDALEAAHDSQRIATQPITLRTGQTARVTFQIP